ncbi:hypothetical protein DDB_G0291522 [Dictyostelium discoideum AX4]|uniref:Uncharacterized transmembrane protein DDB_G0291522 n=1 Tax=Dictyostelium discoideum TaxID=44689 RepID=Y3950_DICDI|nr:hypothetical protein DDB_G0291522 [Dictyostelium discoideum AX4]Q54EG5.1 RecName: Full=Uncharacterized transmembrane protein DDB_G0291522 [Dictyostelium discoideum]EAL61745.1 hypothetical protein DDB_G0291522 [Dictyostelium discoideum AX4]|eukprot:XP_635275.1 hypothetical protein DDB_G0291522 [Dictyostelium discoideum AX4]
MCNSIILENKIFDSQWDNKNHTLFENLMPRDNNNLIENSNYDNNNINNNNNNNNTDNDNDNNNDNEPFYNSNIPNEMQINKYSRFGFKPSQPISKKNENQIEFNNILSFSIKSFLLLILYILFFNYQLYSKYFIILLSLNLIITLISIKSIFKYKNLKKLKNILIYKIQSKIIIL